LIGTGYRSKQGDLHLQMPLSPQQLPCFQPTNELHQSVLDSSGLCIQFGPDEESPCKVAPGGTITGVPIPEQLTSLWNHINDETTMVHAYWSVFEQLFRQSPDQIDLLNRSAGFFFVVVQDALATDIQLTLSKLADSSETFRNANATVERLFNEIEPFCTPEVASILKRLCGRFKDACAPIQKRRNKIIAHTDRDIALSKVAAPPDVTVAQITEALSALSDFTNAIQAHFEDSQTAYGHFGMRGAGAVDLVCLLRMADRYQVLKKDGKIPWND
jgi:hypothetical protein